MHHVLSFFRRYLAIPMTRVQLITWICIESKTITLFRKLGHTKWVIRSRKSKNRQHNGHAKNNKNTKVDKFLYITISWGKEWTGKQTYGVKYGIHKLIVDQICNQARIGVNFMLEILFLFCFVFVLFVCFVCLFVVLFVFCVLFAYKMYIRQSTRFFLLNTKLSHVILIVLLLTAEKKLI